MRGRIRTIKPEALLDEGLWDLEQETGFPIFRAFVGLLCHADREGRFEWRPRALKVAILPYWEGDFSRVLDALTTRGLLVRYAWGTREYGCVRTFTKHQTINAREAESVLPAPPAETDETPTVPKTSTRDPRVTHASTTVHVHARVEGKGREGNGREGSDASRTRAAAVAEPWVDPEPEPSPNAPRPATVRGALVSGYREAFEREFKSMPTDVRGSEADEAVRAVLARASVLERDPCELAKSSAAHWFRENSAKWQKPPRWAWFLKDIGALLADAVAHGPGPNDELPDSEITRILLGSLTGSPS